MPASFDVTFKRCTSKDLCAYRLNEVLVLPRSAFTLPSQQPPCYVSAMNEELERAGKALPLLVAGLYVVGFIVVGVYLSGYGVSSLELFRVQYLAAGFWCAFPFLFFYFVTGRLRNLLRDFDSLRRLSPVARAAATTAAVDTIGLVLILAAGLVRALVPHSASVGTGIFVIALHLSVSVLIGLIVRMLGADLCRVVRGVLQDKDLRGMVDSFGLMFLLTWALLFSRHAYPLIPFSVGGGRPRDVVFVPNEPAQQSAATSFLVREGQGPQTVSYKLLLENESSFVVISPKDGQSAIEFDRKTVAAMIVLGKRPKSADNP